MADFIPGVNVGNIFRQAGSFVGLAPQADYDIFDNMTISGREGQTNVLPGTPGFGQKVEAKRPAPNPNPPVGNTPTYTGPTYAAPQATYNPGVTYNGKWFASQGEADAARRADIERGVRTSQAGYRDAAIQQATDVRNKYQNDTQKWLATLQNTQDEINSGLANNALNLRRSMSNIASGIRQGIKSGGVQLANMNAVDSGAAEAMARAYATMGNQQAGDANNEAALAANELGTQQVKLDRDRDEGIAGFDREREAELSRIRGDLHNKLAALDAEAASKGVNGVVDMNIVNAVVNQAVAQLAAVDNIRKQRLGGISAFDAARANQEAARMDEMGMEGSSPFSAGTEGIAFGQGGESPMGAATSQLPQYARDENGNLIAPPRTQEDEQYRLV